MREGSTQNCSFLRLWRFKVLCTTLVCASVLAVCAPSESEASERPSAMDVLVRSRIAAQYPVAVSVSYDGTKILLRIAKWESDELTVIDARTQKPVATIEAKDTPLSVSWSPDGSDIAFFAAPGNGERSNLLVWNLSGQSLQRMDCPATKITTQPPRWSSDGSSLAYLVGSFDDATLWTVSVRDPHGARPLITHIHSWSDFDWSPDMREVVFAQRDAPSILRFASADTGAITRSVPISNAPSSEIRDLSWSPDGSAIAVAGQFEGDFRSLVRVNVQERTISLCASDNGDVIAPHYAADNRTIIYSLARNSQLTLQSTVCDGKPPRPIGFESGSSRVLRLLTKKEDAVEHHLSMAVLHTSPESPPILYGLLPNGGEPKLIYRTPASAELSSSPAHVVAIKSDDGLEVPTVFWPSRVEGRLSSNVVLVDVHGGPQLQSLKRWESLPSLLTKLGVDVLSPNYRGSSGYGRAFEQWGNTSARVRDILAVCKYARTLHGPHTKVLLMGTSYGTFLSASAAALDPNAVDGLILVSLVSAGRAHPQLLNPPFPIISFHGQNDPLNVGDAHALVSSFFGDVSPSYNSSSLFRVVIGEGHVFRHARSWTEVYSAVINMAEQLGKVASPAGSN